MLSTQQKTCIELVLKNLPDPIKESPIILDVADDSMRHIMGGDPLETLRIKCSRQIITNLAMENQEKWINYLKTRNLDNFSNCFLNKSPELMMSIFDHCPWAASDAEKEVKISIKSRKILVDIDNRNFINVSLKQEDCIIPQWMPYLFRRFCVDGVNKIDVQFEGPENELEQLQSYERQLLAKIQETNYAARNNHIYQNVVVDWKYNLIRGSVCFAAHQKRKGGATVFAKLSRCQSTIKRDVNEVIKTDFA